MFCLKQASQHVSQTSPFVLIFSEKSTLVKTNQIKYKLYSITSQLFYLYVAAPLHFFFISEYFKMQENWISNEKRQTQSSIHGNRYHRKCHGMPCRFFFYLKKIFLFPSFNHISGGESYWFLSVFQISRYPWQVKFGQGKVLQKNPRTVPMALHLTLY